MSESLRNGPDAETNVCPRPSGSLLKILSMAAAVGGPYMSNALFGRPSKPEKEWWVVAGLAKADIEALEKAYAKRRKNNPGAALQHSYQCEHVELVVHPALRPPHTQLTQFTVDDIFVGEIAQMPGDRYAVRLRMLKLKVSTSLRPDYAGFTTYENAREYATNMLLRYIRNFDVRP